ncbi:hypothetical protein CO051_02380 [Candidatus Roizmanbacteria bacterium CG_4_9_14_0_2_um_filter_39_13]|uniref:site-specific DNA-methyltransferase (adenine-specific) n=2 Tax=Candidatus Roizmaniibacteriota TaxID=1752723 RepID=A0A2M8F0Q1_9BACT|nr:MAG: hypothetical protein CO051_02380 [Candidatus Roizmanbacteria bacterium CG_4_9_14_0_2_um_filter_39_13]PJE61412.1 MAG: hypothetical protein COU87_04755 [Candidatus Roizmanbacteria bacterium CG10_big_fil_rev_8_21_14_0_10_39_12]
MESIKLLQGELNKLSDSATENSLYTPLTLFLKLFATEINHPYEINPIVIESLVLNNVSIGFPDLTVKAKYHNWQSIGWIEVKNPNQSLDNPVFKEQFDRYKGSLSNVLFTNLREWALYQWDRNDKPQLVKQAHFDVRQSDNDSKSIKELLTLFLQGKPLLTTTPKKLAVTLAKRAKLLSRQIEETLEYENTRPSTQSYLRDLKASFEKTLIDDMDSHQFANIVAETLAYSLFLGALEYKKLKRKDTFSIVTAGDYLPKNVPILRELYSLAVKTSDRHDNIKYAIQSLVEQLEHSNIEKIYSRFKDHKITEDPVIYFYEPFLHEYDKDEKDKRGVFYTPKEVVDFIVRGVDHILINSFNRRGGIAHFSEDHPEETVHILDPAAGTGTFLMSAIQLVYEKNVKLKNLGEHIFIRMFSDVVRKHILKNFYAFELLVAPYAIAHLKLTLELERLGFSFDKVLDNERLGIYLTNTLDDPDRVLDDMPLFPTISEEAKLATDVKNKKPILVIMGNPPYSVKSANTGVWITGLMERYKRAVKSERNIQPLSDDYIKFIRFSEWKIENTGSGIVAMITNHSFIDGLIHRGMREQLMKTYDEIFIMDLHGNTTIGEQNPIGGSDQNVFPIKQGVCIFFFVKKEIPNLDLQSKVYHSELWGTKKYKLEALFNLKFNEVKWNRLLPEETKNFFFVPKDSSLNEEYASYPKVDKIFTQYSCGVVTSNDQQFIDFDSINLINKNAELLKDFKEPTIVNYLYRPFDIRKILYQPTFLGRARLNLMKNYLRGQNIGLICSKQFASHKYFTTFISNTINDKSSQPFAPFYNFPLYLYQEFQGEIVQSSNLKQEFIDQIKSKLEVKTLSPDEVFYYIYAVMHSPIYRDRYLEQLKIDFPRIPFTTDNFKFDKMVILGKKLINLHLLGENPFDKNPTIFSDKLKWDITFSLTEEGKIKPDTETHTIDDIKYMKNEKQLFINKYAYFEGIKPEVWGFYIGGYQVIDKWLKERKRHAITLSADDLLHVMKVSISINETIKTMQEIDTVISFPLD